MLSFCTYFFVCNIFITILIGVLFLFKRIFHHILSERVQYQLGFLVFLILAVPFVPFRPMHLMQLISWTDIFGGHPTAKDSDALTIQTTVSQGVSFDWFHDFSVSVTKVSASLFHYLLLGIWLLGMFVMLLLALKSKLHLYYLERSAMPLQNQKVCSLFQDCMEELHVQKNIFIYSTAFLKSPMIVGLLKPRIYIPIAVIADCKESEIRYMLLHELQHYKHKDALVNHFINLAGILYWFNPVIWHVLKEIQIEREIACDSSVLQMLKEEEYTDYGNTLIHFAEKISFSPLTFSAGIGGNIKQLKKRIINIASYRPAAGKWKTKEYLIWLLTAIFIITSASFLPAYAAEKETISFSKNNCSYEDLSAFFKEYDGCFVLYDMQTDFWQIYNKEFARERISPDSTYKIYSALLALENQLITPEHSAMEWDRKNYSIAEWNQNQNLASAMRNSVNWYFQTLDQKAGLETLKDFYEKLDYGNHNLSGGETRFWMESSLKISAIEQVELLKKLYENEFEFKEQNIQAVKDAMYLSSSDKGTLYGKTGTGMVNGKTINGWFIGFVERSGHTYFFACNIRNHDTANGAKASEIAIQILKNKKIYE